MASVNILPGLTICGWIQYHLTSACSFPPNAGSVLQLIRLKQHGLLSSPNTLRFWQYVKHFQNYTRLNKTAAYLETTNLKEYLASNFSLALGLSHCPQNANHYSWWIFQFRKLSKKKDIYKITKTKLGIKVKLILVRYQNKILNLSWHAPQKSHIARACPGILEGVPNKWSDQKHVFY